MRNNKMHPYDPMLMLHVAQSVEMEGTTTGHAAPAFIMGRAASIWLQCAHLIYRFRIADALTVAGIKS